MPSLGLLRFLALVGSCEVDGGMLMLPSSGSSTNVRLSSTLKSTLVAYQAGTEMATARSGGVMSLTRGRGGGPTLDKRCNRPCLSHSHPDKEARRLTNKGRRDHERGVSLGAFT